MEHKRVPADDYEEMKDDFIVDDTTTLTSYMKKEKGERSQETKSSELDAS
jgi:hypothetical protein